MTELIITEKPQAASKIAAALADGKPIKENDKGVPYYKITRGKKDILVGCAVGHLFTLSEKNKKGYVYPIFDIEWVPSGDAKKESSFSKKYLSTLKKLAKESKEFTVACDYDVEGEVIGLNIIRHICNKKDGNRMKFSTLTKPDIVKAYETKMNHLDWGQANAGEARHFLDWMYGINSSRALMAAIKKAGSFKVMSSGRVQGPSLKIIVDREKEIKAFKPEPFWQIELNGKAKKDSIVAWHKKDKFWKKEEAEDVMKKVKGEKKGSVSDVKTNRFNQSPPTPFDLTSLQTEAYRCHRIQPKETLSIAQELYIGTFISYPRTSSQKLPKEIGIDKIMHQLAAQEIYAPLVKELLKKPLHPNEGKKSDPAHPAIYPTGVVPSNLKPREQKIYDLIVRRFLATFGEVAVRETMIIDIDVKKEPFVAQGTRTVEKGWHVYYGAYVKLEEEELPHLAKEDVIDITKIAMHDKETQPPKRYTPASIIKELEKRNLGTKSTRAQIIDTLFERGYAKGKAIEATDLGIKTCEMLEKAIPEIVDEELTRHFELEMDEIREGKKTEQEVIDEAKVVLTKIFTEFKKKEKTIGEGLIEANKEMMDKESSIGPCPNCKEGILKIRRGKFGLFAACDKYPDCKTTLSLPAGAKVQVTDKICEHCKHPMIMIIRKANAPQEICINKECPGKKSTPEAEHKNVKGLKGSTIGMECPLCKKGKMTLRKSIYGEFLGCSDYPKCKYTEKIS